jgi:phenylalanyl-tRNA synthetase beta chain
MLCSSEELELEGFELGVEEVGTKGLWTLPDDFRVGVSLRTLLHLDDYIIDIDNKSITHRPDLWGHYGFARELGSLLDRKVKEQPGKTILPISADVDNIPGKIKTTIEGKSAIVYSSAHVNNIQIRPSSFKIQARLLGVGMRPINNVVDVSNYVMLELGQPNHAFDRESIQGDISVSFSKAGEKLTLLDSREMEFPEGIVFIRDGQKPIALGGVMGGENTEVTSSTKSIFIESATFYREHIRKVVAQTAIRTEASQRFEKGQDPENSVRAIHRFAELLHESCPALQMGEIDSVVQEQPRRNQIDTSITHIRNRLGDLDITAEGICKILDSLGMLCRLSGDSLSVTVPTYRSYFDITMAEDLVEEIGRVVGYNEIKRTALMVSCEVPGNPNHQRTLENNLRGLVSNAYQFSEVFNYAFHSEKQVALDKRLSETAVRLLNSVNKDLEYMRISPLPGLLNNIHSNYKETPEVRFFEIERIFIPRQGEKTAESLPDERYFLAGVLTSEEDIEKSMASMSGMISDLLVRIGCSYNDQQWKRSTEEIFHPGRGGQVCDKTTGKTLIKWGEVHPRLLTAVGIQKRVYYFEGFIADLLEVNQKGAIYYKPVTRYPSSDFELTILMDQKSEFADLARAIGDPVRIQSKDIQTETILESVDYLTTYTGQSVPEGKKAVSIRVVWRNRSRTLEHDELKGLQDQLIDSVNEAGFSLR